jgi:hypothetical protein
MLRLLALMIVVVFNAIFNNISLISWRSFFIAIVNIENPYSEISELNKNILIKAVLLSRC